MVWSFSAEGETAVVAVSEIKSQDQMRFMAWEMYGQRIVMCKVCIVAEMASVQRAASSIEGADI